MAANKRQKERRQSTSKSKQASCRKVKPPMSDDSRQVVFLSVVGTTPAVLTETIYALVTRPEPIVPDRIIAVTSADGRDVLNEQLFKRGNWNQLRDFLIQKRGVSPKKLLFGQIGESVRVFPSGDRTRELDDIRTIEDNEAVAEFLMEVVRGFVENESIRLVASLAGGRKTTSALLHSVMTLLGRSDDLLTHIIVDEPWPSFRDFFFPGCRGEFKDPVSGKRLKSDDAVLHLAEVPFVPLRYLFARDLQRCAGSYVRLMNQLRARTMNLEDELTVKVDRNGGEVRINDRLVRLGPNEFLFYLYFAKRAAGGQSPVESLPAIEDDLKRLKQDEEPANDLGHWASRALSGRFDPQEDLRKWANTIRTQITRAGFDKLQVNRLVPHRGHLAIQVPATHVEIS
jgi:CRISPR-associated protein (TIGR02584 family)